MYFQRAGRGTSFCHSSLTNICITWGLKAASFGYITSEMTSYMGGEGKHLPDLHKG